MCMQVAPNVSNWLRWFEDEQVKIEFDKIPKTNTLDYMPWAKKEEIKEVDEKPYINRVGLWVKITYRNKVIYFYIPKGYRWNGANIPALVWLIIGNPDDPKFRLASMIHDWLCEYHKDCGDDRYLSTIIFCGLLKVANVPDWKIFLCKHNVDNFQKLFGKDLNGNKWGK